MALIYHIARKKDWEKALSVRYYLPKGFNEVGFIHFSTFDQLLESANLHFAEEKDLMVFSVQEKRLKDLLKWEPGRNEEQFPHLYSRLELDFIEDLLLMSKDKDGKWKLG